jgi:peroxiredoxin
MKNYSKNISQNHFNKISILLIFTIYFILTAFHQSSAQDAKEILTKFFENARKNNSAEFSLEFKFQRNIDTAAFVFKPLVKIKRDDNMKKIGVKVWIEYYKDNINTFNGKSTKWLVPEQKKMIIDTIRDSEQLIASNWIYRPIKWMVSNDTSKFNFLKNVCKIEKLDTVIDNVSCYLVVSNSINFSDTVGYDPTLPEQKVTTEYFISHSGFEMKKIHEFVVMKDDSYFESEFAVSNVKLNTEISNEIFILTAPAGYATEYFKIEDPASVNFEKKSAPDFTLKNEKGENVSLKDFRGKVVLLDFWGTWCGWCVRSMPHIQRVYEKLKDKGVVVIGISCQERAGADPEKFMKGKGFNYGLLLKGDDVAYKYGVTGFPTFYLINQEGTIIYYKSGYMENLDAFLIEKISKELN